MQMFVINVTLGAGLLYRNCVIGILLPQKLYNQYGYTRHIPNTTYIPFSAKPGYPLDSETVIIYSK